MTYRAKLLKFVKARHFKKLSASQVKILARGKLQNPQLVLNVQNW